MCDHMNSAQAGAHRNTTTVKQTPTRVKKQDSGFQPGLALYFASSCLMRIVLCKTFVFDAERVLQI